MDGYSRVVVEALSTKIGFSCRTHPISTVVVGTTEKGADKHITDVAMAEPQLHELEGIRVI